MVGNLGSRLAQLANARRIAEGRADGSRQEFLEQEAAANLQGIERILVPHVEEFNRLTEGALHIGLELSPPRIVIRQSRLSLLTLEVTANGAQFIRSSGVYSSDDYFTVDRGAGGAMTFRNYSVEVARPKTADEFAELVLIEALGLNP